MDFIKHKLMGENDSSSQTIGLVTESQGDVSLNGFFEICPGQIVRLNATVITAHNSAAVIRLCSGGAIVIGENDAFHLDKEFIARIESLDDDEMLVMGDYDPKMIVDSLKCECLLDYLKSSDFGSQLDYSSIGKFIRFELSGRLLAPVAISDVVSESADLDAAQDLDEVWAMAKLDDIDWPIGEVHKVLEDNEIYHVARALEPIERILPIGRMKTIIDSGVFSSDKGNLTHFIEFDSHDGGVMGRIETVSSDLPTNIRVVII